MRPLCQRAAATALLLPVSLAAACSSDGGSAQPTATAGISVTSVEPTGTTEPVDGGVESSAPVCDVATLEAAARTLDGSAVISDPLVCVGQAAVAGYSGARSEAGIAGFLATSGQWVMVYTGPADRSVQDWPSDISPMLIRRWYDTNQQSSAATSTTSTRPPETTLPDTPQ